MALFAGSSVCVMLGVIFSLRLKGLFRLVLNIFFGALCLFLLGFVGIPYFPLNALNAFIVGVFGAPGLAIIFALSVF